MRRFLFILSLAALLLCMLFYAPIVISGAHIGLELWYESVLPSILPFMIITSLLLQQVQGNGVCYLGLFCGLPVGANLVNQQAEAGQLSPWKANALICICNITSPMFISGYILNQTFQGHVPPLRFFLTVYIPLGAYALWHFLLGRIRKEKPSFLPGKRKPGRYGETTASSLLPAGSVPSQSLDSILRRSLQVILMVGIYIMLFCILIQFLVTFLPSGALWPKLLTAGLEITNGIHLLMKLPLEFHQKTALIAGLTSFGGVCSVLQTKSVLTSQGLSILHYTIVKLCMGGVSYLLALLWL